jgi:hypothetical protein
MFLDTFSAQVNSRVKKRVRFNPDSLPTIDPLLVSINCLSARLIAVIDDVYRDIITAESNDGLEVTILRHYGNIASNPDWYEEDRVEIDGAFNILIGDTFDSLHEAIRTWWYKNQRIFLFGMDFINSHETIEPNAPIEIKHGLQAIEHARVKRKPLTDMVDAIHYPKSLTGNTHNLAVAH